MQFSQILAFTLVAFSAAPSGQSFTLCYKETFSLNLTAFAKPMPVDTTNLAPAVALKYEALEVPVFFFTAPWMLTHASI